MALLEDLKVLRMRTPHERVAAGCCQTILCDVVLMHGDEGLAEWTSRNERLCLEQILR